MPPGDLIFRNGQYEFRGLVLGGGSDYIVERVQGLFDLPHISDQDEDRQDQHGFFPGALISAGRTVDMDIHALGIGETDTFAKLDTLMRTFSITPYQEALVFQRPGWGKRLVYGRVYKRSFPSNYELAQGHIDGAVMIKCSDPRIYSWDEQNTTWSVAAGASSGSATVVNNGHVPTAPIVTLTGAWNNPAITNQADGNRAVRLNIVTAAGDTLIIDHKTRTVLRNGLDVTSAVLRQDSRWWDVQPGNNLVTVSRTGTTGTSGVSVRRRHAWM